MLKNKFRMMIGILILLVFGVAIVQFVRQARIYGGGFVGGALLDGFLFLGFIGLLLWGVYQIDRRRKRSE